MNWKVNAVAGQAALMLGLAQSTAFRPALEIARLEPPVYPPIAMAARVSGDVDLKITLKTDGTPGTVQVESGPQMLRQAAVDSASRSRFTGVPGGGAEATYKIIYKFALEKALGCGQERDKSYPHIHSGSNTITISEQPVTICDPVADEEPVHVRSVKCLYLWKCRQR